MNQASAHPSVSGSILGASGQAAIGTNIRQQAVFLTVEIAPGDPAALDRVAEQIHLYPIADRVTSSARDFPGLIGRDAAVAAADEAIEGRGSVAAFGEDGIGKSVLLRHLARRSGTGFTRGIALIPAGGMLWQDIGQEVVRAFFRAEVPIHLGPSQLRSVLGDLDALLLLDDVDPNADIGQLFALIGNAAFVVASTRRLLPGESRAVHLEGLDAAGIEALIRQTLADLGAPGAVDPDLASRIGMALDGHPGRVIRTVEDAFERHVDLPTLAAELTNGFEAAAAASGASLGSANQAVVDAVAALDGTPIGPEHVVAVVPDASTDTVDDLLRRRVLRAASPQVRLDTDLATAHRHSGDDPDAIRARYVEHFVTWARGGAANATAIADESRAILYLLDWAERSGRVGATHALSTATEGAFAIADRWGAWARATGYRLRAAETLGLDADAAVALNQIGVQALGDDAPDRAREAFMLARDRALVAGAPGVAAVAVRNIEIIDGLPLPGPKDEPPQDQSSGSGHGDVIPRPWWQRWPLFLAGIAGLIVVAGLVYLFLGDRRALAIDPAEQAFQTTSVDADGERVAFTVTNRGTARLDELEVALSGDAAGEFFIVGGDCPGSSLEAGRSCSVELLFHPTRAGEGRATLRITARDGTVVLAPIQSLASEPSASPSAVASASPPSPSDPPSPEPAGQPDLAIVSFAPIGAPERGDFWLLPVEVVIVNAGDGEAGLFPIVITADDEPVSFDVPGEDPNALATRTPLGPNERISYTGIVWLPLETHLDEVRIVVRTDSCRRDPGAPAGCRIVETNERNNSYPLQVVDLQVTNLNVDEPQEPPGFFVGRPGWVNVPVSFDVRNAGTQPANDFWIAAFLGQIRGGLQVKGLEVDPARGSSLVPGLDARGELHLEGVVAVPRTSLRSQLTIVVGCPPGAEPCQIPEIAFENNVTSAPIPVPRPTPAPTDAPIF